MSNDAIPDPPMPRPGYTVGVNEVAHGGYEVSVRIPAGADLRSAKQLAREIRNGHVDLSDLGWRT